MKNLWYHLIFAGLVFSGAGSPQRALAHVIGDEPHHHGNWQASAMLVVISAGQMKPDTVLLAQSKAGEAASPATAVKEGIATSFKPFAPRVKTRSDGKYLYVESDGMPAHNMMVGITSWQQQVPLPQPYSGNNAWRIPLQPVPAKEPVSIKNRFLRGAVAVAVNGIPIFNPQNNRGEISQEIGELDQWGGHCGRADDYHYHATPFHLENIVGKGKPLAYALDGYPIYGLTEPDGSTPSKLDAFNGHHTAGIGYHYHGSNKYPYVNGGFYGEVTEREGQVDPQPRAQGMREAGTPLRGARITGFSVKENKSYVLNYELGSEKRTIQYTILADGSARFEFIDGRGASRNETYSLQQRPRNGGSPGENKGKDGQKKRPEPKGGGNRPPPP